MKAWIVSDEYDEYSTVVFAETRNQARLEALRTECCNDMDYLSVRPMRFKEADSMYRGRREMDWCDIDDRKFLARYGWSCLEPDYSVCPECPASTLCNKYSDYVQEIKEVNEDETDI